MAGALPLVLALLSAGDGGVADHAFEGAVAFGDGRFAESLVEFDVALELGAGPNVLWYRAAALAKLGRPEDALEAFARARKLAPEGEDALLGFYLAGACQSAHLLVCADKALENVGQAAGPRVGELVKRMRAEIAGVLAQAPPKDAIDLLRQRAAILTQTGRTELAELYAAEVVALETLREAKLSRSAAADHVAPKGASADGGGP